MLVPISVSHTHMWGEEGSHSPTTHVQKQLLVKLLPLALHPSFQDVHLLGWLWGRSLSPSSIGCSPAGGGCAGFHCGLPKVDVPFLWPLNSFQSLLYSGHRLVSQERSTRTEFSTLLTAGAGIRLSGQLSDAPAPARGERDMCGTQGL